MMMVVVVVITDDDYDTARFDLVPVQGQCHLSSTLFRTRYWYLQRNVVQ